MPAAFDCINTRCTIKQHEEGDGDGIRENNLTKIWYWCGPIPSPFPLYRPTSWFASHSQTNACTHKHHFHVYPCFECAIFFFGYFFRHFSREAFGIAIQSMDIPIDFIDLNFNRIWDCLSKRESEGWRGGRESQCLLHCQSQLPVNNIRISAGKRYGTMPFKCISVRIRFAESTIKWCDVDVDGQSATPCMRTVACAVCTVCAMNVCGSGRLSNITKSMLLSATSEKLINSLFFN